MIGFGAGRPHDRPLRRLIVNADDLGLAPAINLAIAELHAAGVVSSASLIMNLPATADALALTAGSDLDIGIHLNLTAGEPMASGSASLVGPDGRFRDPAAQVGRLMRGRLKLREVEREWAAQIEAFLATGRAPAHLDTHTHLHAIPGFTEVTLRLAHRYGIGAVRARGHGLVIRQVMPWLPRSLAERLNLPLTAAAEPPSPTLVSNYLLVLTAAAPHYNQSIIANVLRNLPAGLTELVTHCGYVDDELRRLDALLWDREKEVVLLNSDWWRELLIELRLHPTTFRDELAYPRR